MGTDMTMAVERRRADGTWEHVPAFGLVQAMWLYGIAKPRGWSTPIFEALVVLHPEAAAHLREHEDPETTMRHFWPSRCAA